MLKVGFAALIAFIVVGCSRQTAPAGEPEVTSVFAPNQVWRYRTRPGEERSRLVVGKVERDAKVGTIIHIKVVGVSLKNPGAPSGRTGEILHIPISAVALESSVLEQIEERVTLDGFEEGYKTWKLATGGKGGGVFTVSVSEIVSFVEEALSHPAG